MTLPPEDNGAALRLLAMFILGMSVGICITLMYLEVFR